MRVSCFLVTGISSELPNKVANKGFQSPGSEVELVSFREFTK